MGYKYLYLSLHVIVFEGCSASNLKSETITLSYKGSLPVLSRWPPWRLRVYCVVSV